MSENKQSRKHETHTGCKAEGLWTFLLSHFPPLGLESDLFGFDESCVRVEELFRVDCITEDCKGSAVSMDFFVRGSHFPTLESAVTSAYSQEVHITAFHLL